MDIAGWLAFLVGFFVRLEARFFVPTRVIAMAARAGAVKDAHLRAREGLSLTAPSTLPGSGASGLVCCPSASNVANRCGPRNTLTVRSGYS